MAVNGWRENICKEKIDKNKVLVGSWSLTVKEEPHLHLKGVIKILNQLKKKNQPGELLATLKFLFYFEIECDASMHLNAAQYSNQVSSKN